MRLKLLCVLVLILSLINTAAFADTITLKDGRVIEGKIVEETKDYVKINFSDVILTYFPEEIDKITRAGPSAQEKIESKPEIKGETEAAIAEYYEKTIQLGAEGKFDEAISYYEKVIQLNPKLLAPYLGIGALYLRMGKFREAIDVLEKGLNINPEAIGPNAFLSVAYKKAGQDNKSRTYLEKTIDLIKRNRRWRGLYILIEELARDAGWLGKQ